MTRLSNPLKAITTALTLLLCSINILTPAVADASDIDCSVINPGKTQVVQKKLDDFNRAEKWEYFELNDGQKIAVACGLNEESLDCTVATNETLGKPNAFKLLVSSQSESGVVDITLPNETNIRCSSASVLKKKNGHRSRSLDKARALTDHELSFCTGLSDFGSILLIDQRALCPRFLRRLPRSLNKKELEYCSKQYSVQGFGWDQRLTCTKSLASE